MGFGASMAGLIFFLLGFLIYSNTFQASFNLDDFPVIVENLAIRRLDLRAIWEAFNARFVVGLTLALNYAFGKLDVFGYHLFNITCHVLSSFLVYTLVLLTFQTPALKESPLRMNRSLIAFFAALLFLAHPVQSQAVNYIWARTASLATFFYLVSVVLYLRARLTSRLPYCFGALLTTLLGMFTKEITFTLPLMLLLCELSFFGHWREETKKRLALLAPFLLTLVIIPLTLTQAGAVVMPVVRTDSDYTCSYPQYLMTQLNVVRTYLRLLFLPINQNLDYDYPVSRSLLEPGVLFSILLLAAIGVGATKAFRKQRLLFFGIIWFFLALSVESLKQLTMIIFEHRLYLPMAGFAVFLSTGLFLLLKDAKKFVVVFSCIIFVSSIATHHRNEVWKDGVSLWKDVIKKSPNRGRGYQNIGLVYFDEGNYDEAIVYCQKAVWIDPRRRAKAYNCLGMAYGKKGDYDKAIAYCQKAIEHDPGLAKAYNNLGIAFGQKGNHTKEIAYYQKAVELDPGYAQAYGNLGTVYLEQGAVDRAIASYEKAVALDPDDAKTHHNLAVAYHRRGNRMGALKQVDRLRALHRPDLVAQWETLNE